MTFLLNGTVEACLLGRLADRNDYCATRMVWEHLLALNKPVEYLAELIDQVHAGDRVVRRSGSAEYLESRRHGLHAHFHQVTKVARDDLGMYLAIREWLDVYALKMAVPDG